MNLRRSTPTPASTPRENLDDGIVHTGSISSTVDLDYAHGQAHKVYHPSFLVRLLYRLAFQARFPYVANHPALEAARLRRRLVDLLTKYWFGHHLVAAVVEIDDVPGGHDFVTQLVRGHEPSDKKRAKAFLHELDRRFMDAGIATWQITPYNPHSITNFIEKDDGTYRIIDLESSLVAFLYPLSHLAGFLRAGLFPSFDDVDCARLDVYLENHHAALEQRLGPEYAELLDVAATYRAAQDQWHATEPRVVNRILRFLFRLVDVPSWVRSFGRLVQKGEGLARERVRAGLDQWAADGRLTRAEADELARSLDAPEVEQAIAHLGAHFAISLPLRFPFGAASRFLYTVTLRLRAEARGLARRGSPRDARKLHTVPVALFALLPGFGRLAYLLSPALAHQPLFAAVPLDLAARKLPLRLYERLHLATLFLYWGKGSASRPPPQHSFRRLAHAIRERHFALRPYWTLIAGIIALNAAFFVAGAAIYLRAGRPSDFWWFGELGPVQTLEAVQLLVAAAAGIGAYRAFWRTPRASMDLAEGFGVFLWGIGGLGLLVFAIDDYTGLHEALGRRIAGFGSIPAVGRLPADAPLLAYTALGIGLLALFKHELFSSRNSTALLIPGALLSMVMVVTDVLAESLALEALELPAQTFAVACLTLAFMVRYLEVSASARGPAARHALGEAA